MLDTNLPPTSVRIDDQTYVTVHWGRDRQPLLITETRTHWAWGDDQSCSLSELARQAVEVARRQSEAGRLLECV